MWNWIKEFFGFKKLCKHQEKNNLLLCLNFDNKKEVKRQINRFIEARKVK